LHTCQSIFNFACNVVHERSEDANVGGEIFNNSHVLDVSTHS